MRKLASAIGLAAMTAMIATAPAMAAERVVKVGITVPLTGAAAALGIGARNALSLAPDHVGDIKIDWIVLDDATDTTRAVVNTNKLISEGKVDVMVGSSTSHETLAIINPIFEAKVPLISLAAAAVLVQPLDDKRKWVFKTAANDSVMAEGIANHMAARGVKTLGVIGFDDSYGESWLEQIKIFAGAKNIAIVDSERFARTDSSAVGQVLKLIAAKPDAILVVGSSAPAAMPHMELKDKGYKGLIYQTHGSASADFLKVGGSALNGSFVSVGPSLVWDQLPDSNPVKKPASEFMPRYEEKFGKGQRTNFAAQAFDAWLILAAAIPEAARHAEPGTQAYRAALRDAIEGIKDLHGNAGVFNFSPTNHAGLDSRGRVIVEIEKGSWKYSSD